MTRATTTGRVLLLAAVALVGLKLRARPHSGIGPLAADISAQTGLDLEGHLAAHAGADAPDGDIRLCRAFLSPASVRGARLSVSLVVLVLGSGLRLFATNGWQRSERRRCSVWAWRLFRRCFPASSSSSSRVMSASSWDFTRRC